MNGFEANPEGIMAKGNRVREIYNNYVTEKNKVDSTVDRIGVAWKDAASNMYISTIHSYDGDFRQLGAVIAQLGDILARHGQRLASSRDALESIASNL